MKMPSCFSFIPLTLLLFSLPASPALGQRSVDIALGLISDRNSFSDRIIAARTMTNEITAGDMPGILHFLKIAPEDLSPFSDSEVASLKNDVADSLFASRHFEYRILTTFEEILGDRSQGVVWREYALQKMPQLYGKPVGGQGHALIREILLRYTAVNEHVFAGTAVLGSFHIYRKTNAAEWKNLTLEASRRILESETMAYQNKITALQILAELSDPQAQLYARGYLEEESPAMLQVSSLAALGFEANEENRRILQNYARSSDFRLRRAAQAALRRM